MDEYPKRVLYAFYPDRYLTFEQVVERSKVSLPFVRNTINKEFIRDGLVEEIQVPKPGQKHNYFRLTDKGRIAANQIHVRREWMRIRMAELINDGKSAQEAAVQVAVESVGLTDLTA